MFSLVALAAITFGDVTTFRTLRNLWQKALNVYRLSLTAKKLSGDSKPEGSLRDIAEPEATKGR
jgi:hypothetical protein